MSEVFSIDLPKNWQDRWPEVKQAAQKYNFDVKRNGDDIAFNGYGVEGIIRVTGNTAHVSIDKKPFFLSLSLIKTKVKQFLQAYG